MMKKAVLPVLCVLLLISLPVFFGTTQDGKKGGQAGRLVTYIQNQSSQGHILFEIWKDQEPLENSDLGPGQERKLVYRPARAASWRVVASSDSKSQINRLAFRLGPGSEGEVRITMNRDGGLHVEKKISH